MTVLDTDVISNYLKPHAADRYPRLTAFVNDLLRSEGLSIAFVTQFELRRGLEASIRRGGKPTCSSQQRQPFIRDRSPPVRPGSSRT
jgi:hypothetical protein